jgi:hypothetical protein
MKVIDLLNKIAKGEEVPKNIKYLDEIYEYSNNDKFYYQNGFSMYRNFYSEGNCLNDEVEIIEVIEDIEYEVIEEITYKPRKVQNAINALIRNQNKIIERMKENE